ncbi:MAG: hypothetical protein CMH57_01835 [Myxococcales bacterium]|nr:hypothetical protein [Myxococcales bacterium]
MAESSKGRAGLVIGAVVTLVALGAAVWVVRWHGVDVGDVARAVAGPSDVIATVPPGSPLPEQPVKLLALTGPLAEARAEVSGLAWAGDALLLLPQYPERLGEGAGAIFALDRGAISAAVVSDTTLTPRPIPLIGDVPNDIDRYEGFEAIATRGDRVWLTIERTVGGPDDPAGDLVWGTLTDEGLRIEGHAPIAPQATISNKAYEALIALPEGPVAFYEINGGAHNPSPHAVAFTPAGRSVSEPPMPPLAYRLTDATGLDREGRFWVINYLWPGDHELVQEEEALRTAYNVGPTHAAAPQVERLVQLQLKRDGERTEVVRVDRAPVYLRLGEAPRNWEGIAWWGADAVLVVTDEHPGTMLGVVQLRP